MIKAIIFDFGGVIGIDGYWAWLQKQVPNFAERELFFHHLADQIDRGTITKDEYLNILTKETGVAKSNIWPEIFQTIAINQELLTIITSLKKQYKIGLLSNINATFLEEIFINHDLYKYFDEMFISSQHGVIKPEAAAFEKCLSMLKVTKDEALFFDDRQVHVDAANKFGLQAFVYTTNEKLTQDLREHGITV